MNETIQSLLQEHRSFAAVHDAHAHFSSADEVNALRHRFDDDYEGTWADLARRELQWQQPFQTTLNQQDAPFYRWFEDGKINVSYNCLDRHLAAGHGDRIALIWEAEVGETRRVSYQQLFEQVCRAANAMKTLGVKKGDRVILYMPMIIESVVAMLACARIGASHSVVFGAFSAQALRDRIHDAAAVLLITADGSSRRGEASLLKTKVDEALQQQCDCVQHVLMVRHCQQPVPFDAGRDVDWATALAAADSDCPAEQIEAEHPLFILYTSGSTGKPKGIVHTTAGYLLWAKLSMQWSFDFRPEQDVFWCTADIGWITGHSYAVYGPLACGGTTVLYEGVPNYPNAGRIWQICADHGVSILYTAPTLIRSLMKAGDAWPAQYDLSRMRVLGTVGEPINPEAWLWYYEQIGQQNCPIIDTWWQTETGGHMLAALPFASATKPGSASQPLPGIDAAIVDADGKEVAQGNGGYLVIRKPWPSMLRGVWGDEQRYRETYWEQFKQGYYVAGDGARIDADGDFWIMGRVDDVLNVSGHRLGTMELESALASHPAVAEAAVVARPHDVKGESIFAFVVLKQNTDDRDTLKQALRAHVAKEIGPIAKPDAVRLCLALPKTRSGKIMRRLLRQIALNEEITQDTSTLEDPSIIESLRHDA